MQAPATNLKMALFRFRRKAVTKMPRLIARHTPIPSAMIRRLRRLATKKTVIPRATATQKHIIGKPVQNVATFLPFPKVG